MAVCKFRFFHAESPVHRLRENSTFGISYFSGGLPANAIQILGLLLIFYPACVYTSENYPSMKILIPCFGCLLLIYNGKNTTCLINKLFANKVLIAIGMLSYSIYLWHWPIISFFNYFKIPLTTSTQLMIVSVTLLLSCLSYSLIEQPFRYRFKFSFLDSIFLFIIIPILIGFIFYISSKTIDNFGFNKITHQQMTQANTYYGKLKRKYGCIDNKEGYSILPSKQLCYIGNINAKKINVLLVGDSHARAWVGMLNVFLTPKKLKAYVVNQSGSPFILGNIENWRENKPMLRNKLIKQLIEQDAYKYVVMGGFWEYYPDLSEVGNKKRIPYETFEKGLREAVKLIVKNNSIPVIVLDNPPLLNIKKTCGLSKISFSKCYNRREEIEKIQKRTKSIILSVKKEYNQTILIDPSRIICDLKYCYSSINKIPLYFSDGANSHISQDGSTFIGKLYLERYGNPFDKGYSYKG